MARLIRSKKLSVVIPSLNEASHLPLLLADLNKWPHQLEICVCDACSSDLTTLVAELAGAKVIQHREPNRGSQLNCGAVSTSGEWLLFLHADSRMASNWPNALENIINNKASDNICWFFDFRVQDKGVFLRLMEIAVAIRSNLFKRPYGDQGLLISRSLYKKIGGYKPLYLMEDLDIIIRITKEVELRRIGLPLFINGRGWKNISVVAKALKNARLRKSWYEGKNSKDLSKEYYNK